MSDQYFTTYSNPDAPGKHPMHGRVSARHGGFADLAGSNSAGYRTACRDGFFERSSNPGPQKHNSIGEDARSATANRPVPVQAEQEAMTDLRKSLGEILEVLVAPAQRQTDARLLKILTLIESHKKNNDRNIDQLTRQFAQMTLKLHKKTKNALASLDHRVDTFETRAEKSRREMRDLMATGIAKLEAATDKKILSASQSVDARISILTTRINGNVNKTIADLGRAISEIGNAVQRDQR